MELNYNAKKISYVSGTQNQFASEGNDPATGVGNGVGQSVQIDTPVHNQFTGYGVPTNLPPLPPSPKLESNIMETVESKMNEMSVNQHQASYPSSTMLQFALNYPNTNQNYRPGTQPPIQMHQNQNYQNVDLRPFSFPNTYQGDVTAMAYPHYSPQMGRGMGMPIRSYPVPSATISPHPTSSASGFQQTGGNFGQRATSASSRKTGGRGRGRGMGGRRKTLDGANNLLQFANIASKDYPYFGMYSPPSFPPSFDERAFTAEQYEVLGMQQFVQPQETYQLVTTPRPPLLPHFVDLRQRALEFQDNPPQGQIQTFHTVVTPVTVPIENKVADKPKRPRNPTGSRGRGRRKVNNLSGTEDPTVATPTPTAANKARKQSTTPRSKQPRSSTPRTPRGGGKGRGRGRKVGNTISHEQTEQVDVIQFTAVETHNQFNPIASVPTIPIGTAGTLNVNIPRGIGTSLNISDTCFSHPESTPEPIIEPTKKPPRKRLPKKINGKTQGSKATTPKRRVPKAKKVTPDPLRDGEPLAASKPRRKYVRKPKATVDQPQPVVLLTPILPFTTTLPPGSMSSVEDNENHLAFVATTVTTESESLGCISSTNKEENSREERSADPSDIKPDIIVKPETIDDTLTTIKSDAAPPAPEQLSPVVVKPTRKKPRSRKPKKTVAEKTEPTASTSKDCVSTPNAGEVDEVKTEIETVVTTEESQEVIDADDERAQACLSQEKVPVVLLDDINMKKEKQRTRQRNSRNSQKSTQQVEHESNDTDEGAVAHRLVPRGIKPRQTRSTPKQHNTTSSSSSDEQVVRRTTRSSTAKFRATIPAKISMADYDSTDSSGDDHAQKPIRNGETDGEKEEKYVPNVEVKQELGSDDEVKPEVKSPENQKRMVRLHVNRRCPRARPRYARRIRPRPTRPRPTVTMKQEEVVKLKVEEDEEIVDVGVEPQMPVKAKRMSIIQKGRVEYTTEELKRLYADECFVISLIEADLEPDMMFIYQINRRENCLRQFYPAKFESLKYFVSSPVRRYFKEGEMTEEKLFLKFQAIPVCVLSEETKTEIHPNRRKLVETKVQYPYIGKQFYIRMTKSLGRIYKTEYLRDDFKKLHIVLAWKCMHYKLIAELRKPDAEQNSLLQTLKPIMQPYFIFADKIKEILNAAVAKAKLPEDILNLIRGFHQMKNTTKMEKPGAACNMCGKVKTACTRIMFCAKGYGWGNPYDLETLMELKEENWPKLPARPVHFCRPCGLGAFKLHRLFHWMFTLSRIILVNMQQDLERLQNKAQIGKYLDKYMLWSESLKSHFRNNMFLEFQVYIADVEIEFEL